MKTYEPVDPEIMERARAAYEAANAYPKLLEQQRGFECQSNPFFLKLMEGVTITCYQTHYQAQSRQTESFEVGDLMYKSDNAAEWGDLMALLECPQVSWRSEMLTDWYSIYRAVVRNDAK